MNRYPTDEELNRFIEELEQEKLYAPRHLKEEILQKAVQTKEEKKSKSKKERPVQMFTYTLKIVAGMAAAIFLVFMIPANYGSSEYGAEQVRKEQTQMPNPEKEKNTKEKDMEEEKEKEKDSLSFRLNDSVRKMNVAANNFFNNLNESLNEFGGEDNED